MLMSTMTMTGQISVEQFEQLPEDVAGNFELVRGELLVVPSHTPCHNIVRDKVFFVLQRFLNEQHLGGSLVNTDFRVGERTVRRPDLAYLAEQKWKMFDRSSVPVSTMPDLVIEILSQTDIITDFNQKVNEYLRAGIPEVWLVYAEDREVHLRRGKAVQILQSNDTLESPVLLPGFSVKVAEIFKEL